MGTERAVVTEGPSESARKEARPGDRPKLGQQRCSTSRACAAHFTWREITKTSARKRPSRLAKTIARAVSDHASGGHAALVPTAVHELMLAMIAVDSAWARDEAEQEK